jgi:hypothetical protein
VRVRQLIAAAVVVLAVTGLTACRSNVGAAAVINGHRISESDVHKYVTVEGPSAAVKANAQQNGQVLVPKSIALNTIVQARVFELVLRGTKGGVPSAADLRAAHDLAAQTLSNGQVTSGAALDAGVAAQLNSDGLNQKLLPIVLRSIDLEYALITRINAKTAADIAKAVQAAHIKVSVNPAYGTWSPSNASVLPPSGSKLPDFLTLHSAGSAAATAS